MHLQNFYKDGGDANLLELISSIRFPLIINASPDRALFFPMTAKKIWLFEIFSKMNFLNSIPKGILSTS